VGTADVTAVIPLSEPPIKPPIVIPVLPQPRSTSGRQEDKSEVRRAEFTTPLERPLPTPPPEVPRLPDGVPSPAFMDEPSVFPPCHDDPVPLPPNHANPEGP
jgi:hypothetical protein